MQLGRTLRAGFLALVASALTIVPVAASRLGDEVVPTFEAIDLTLDADQADYGGRVRIELRVNQPTDRFRFHAEGLELDRFTLSGANGEVPIDPEPESGGEVVVRTATPLAVGPYTLTIEFRNRFDTTAVGLYRMETDGAAYAFTHFSFAYARQAFPCWDEPRFKIPFQMTLRVPPHHLAVANTPVADQTVADGWRTVVFEKTRPLPTYLLALATGPLETVPMPGLGVPARIVTVRGQSHLAGGALAVTPPILRALEEYFGGPYPFKKLDFIAVPEFWPGGMENPGAITFTDLVLLLDPATASVAVRRDQAWLIAHELAHMWFGDMVTMEWWDDLWLNESFADWMMIKIVEQVRPELNSAVVQVRRVHGIRGILDTDARVTTTAIRKPISSPHYIPDWGLAYPKGRSVLGMFEHWLGADRFRRGVIAYLRAHAWGNATAADLWQALDKATGQNVTATMATFIEQPGFPRIGVEDLGGGRIRLSQERFRNLGTTSPDFLWQVPVRLKYPDAGGIRTRTVLLDAPSKVFALDLAEANAGGPAWIYPNAGPRGYYRWTVPGDRLRALTADASAVLAAPERVELIGNLTALLTAGTLRGDEYLEMLTALAEDPHPLVVESVTDALDRVKLTFVTPELEEAFASYLRRTLGPALERFGLERKATEDESVPQVRRRLYWWLGKDGRDQRLRRHALELTRSFLAEPTAVDPELVDAALQLAAIDGDRKLFDQYRQRFESARVPGDRYRYLPALGAFARPELRRAALRYMLEGPLRPTEMFAILGSSGLADDAQGRAIRYQWFTENYDRLMDRLPPEYRRFGPRMAGWCSAERLAAGRKFFAGQSDPGIRDELDKVAEEVTDCLRLRAREGGAVARYLNAVAARPTVR